MSSTPRNSYIGLTSMTLKERLSAHKYQGSIYAHYRNIHQKSPNLEVLLRLTDFENNPKKLSIFEALHIRKLKPSLNENKEDFYCLNLNII